MGKHRHSKDKMFITYTELKQEWDGKKEHKRLPFSKLPFYCCSLSLSPFENPMCSPQGHVFEMLHIIPFLKKYGKNPVTGQPQKASDLIKMNWSKNQKGQFQDPVSYKVFTQYTKIVCIKTSGNVYAFDTIEELNKKPKFYFDLIDNQPFTVKDIIVIQDPKDARLREVQQFDFVKKNIQFESEQKLQPRVEQSLTMQRVMDEVGEKRKRVQEQKQKQREVKKRQKLQKESREDVSGFIQWCIQNKIYQHQRFTDLNSASLTSTSFTPNTSGKSQFRQLKQDQIRKKIYQQIKRLKLKGYVQMKTNRGTIILMVHCDITPKTGENFLELCQTGYYDGCHFHRLVKDFCLQGGDPTGTGTGGISIFGKIFVDEFSEKLSHSKAGILSMANSGPHTNGSQFFLTLASCQQLDNKHTVFGEVVEGLSVLYHINKTCASSKHQKPKEDIFIQKMNCYDNPYRKVIQMLKQSYKKGHKDFQEFELKKTKERWIEKEQQGQFKLPEVRKDHKPKTSLSSQVLNGYM